MVVLALGQAGSPVGAGAGRWRGWGLNIPVVPVIPVEAIIKAPVSRKLLMVLRLPRLGTGLQSRLGGLKPARF